MFLSYSYQGTIREDDSQFPTPKSARSPGLGELRLWDLNVFGVVILWAAQGCYGLLELGVQEV